MTHPGYDFFSMYHSWNISIGIDHFIVLHLKHAITKFDSFSTSFGFFDFGSTWSTVGEFFCGCVQFMEIPQ